MVTLIKATQATNINNKGSKNKTGDAEEVVFVCLIVSLAVLMTSQIWQSSWTQL